MSEEIQECGEVKRKVNAGLKETEETTETEKRGTEREGHGKKTRSGGASQGSRLAQSSVREKM